MFGKRCPACDSVFTPVIQPIFCHRKGNTVDQHYCMECESFFHVSGYREDDSVLKADCEFLERHPGDYRKFVRELKAKFPEAKTVLEIGCGTGELLGALKRKGFDAKGIDVNPHAVKLARERGHNAIAGYFKKTEEKFDLILSVDVLEHTEAPRDIIKDAVSMLNPDGGMAIRVPIVDRKHWKYLNGVSQRRDFEFEDPFRDNSVHITHFSTRGLMRMMKDFNLNEAGCENEIYIFSFRQPAQSSPPISLWSKVFG